jgi:hypothetical protein
LNYGRRRSTTGYRNGNTIKISCGFPDWVFNFINERATDREISFNAALQAILEEAIEVDLECSLDEYGLQEIADMDTLKLIYGGKP